MKNTLKEFVRAALMLEQPDPLPDVESEFDPANIPTDTQGRPDPQINAFVNSYKYIESNFDIFYRDAQSELDNFGGIGAMTTRWDTRAVNDGFIKMLEADKQDINSTGYPIRTAIFLTGVLNGTGFSLKDFLLPFAGVFGAIIDGIETVNESRQVRGKMLNEASTLGKLTDLLSAAMKKAGRFISPTEAADLARKIEKPVDLYKRALKSSLLSANPGELAAVDDNVVKIVEALSLKRAAGHTEVTDAVIEEIIMSRLSSLPPGSKDQTADLIRAIWKSMGEMSPQKARYGRTLTISYLASFGIGAFLGTFKGESPVNEEATKSLVRLWSIRKDVKEKRDELIRFLRDSSLIDVGLRGEVLPSKLAAAIEYTATTCLPGPSVEAKLVSADQIETAIAKFKSNRA